MTDTTPVPPVPSREAVDLKEIKLQLQSAVTYDETGFAGILGVARIGLTLLAEVERLTKEADKHWSEHCERHAPFEVAWYEISNLLLGNYAQPVSPKIVHIKVMRRLRELLSFEKRMGYEEGFVGPSDNLVNTEMIEVKELYAENQELRTTVAQLEREVYVPGSWRCAKCSLVIQKSVLHVGDGALVSSDNTPDNCPNCNVPMWRMSERDERKEAQRSFSDLFDKYQQLERTVADQAAALAERDKDAERWRAGEQRHEFPQFCSHDNEAPSGSCWYMPMFGLPFQSASEAIDAALAASVSTQEKPK